MFDQGEFPVKGKVVAAFLSRVPSEYGVGRWDAFRRQISDAVALLTGVQPFWMESDEHILLVAPGETWAEADEHTKRILKRE